MTMTTTIPQAAPRGLDVIIEDVQQRAARPHCSAGRTQPCALPRPGGCHMARFARARREGLITAAEMAAVIKAAGVFTNGTVIRGGMRVAYLNPGSHTSTPPSCWRTTTPAPGTESRHERR